MILALRTCPADQFEDAKQQLRAVWFSTRDEDVLMQVGGLRRACLRVTFSRYVARALAEFPDA